jgi:hypothetical protein
MQIELPITNDYVSDWGPWEGIRELVQNAVDEETLNGHQMSVTHDGEWLHVRSVGADMNRAALLLGKTTKKDVEKARGQFGEGLDLAFLALTRAGLDVECRTQSEKWVPRLGPSEEYAGETVLIVGTRRMPTQVSWVEVSVRIPAEDWAAMKSRFLFLDPAPEGEYVKTYYGTILFEERRKHMVFVKGIFVAINDKVTHGYDMNNVKLDRDRRVVDTFDLSWNASQMYQEAVARSPEMADRTYRLLKDGCEDVRYLGSMYVSDSVRRKIVEAFEAEHGKNAMAVSSIAESREMAHVGFKGIVVDKPLREIIEAEKGTAIEAKVKKGRDVQEWFSWDDLIEDEQEILTRACSLIDDAVDRLVPGSERAPLMERLEVVTFNDSDVQGTAKNQRVRIGRVHLLDLRMTLTILIHEEAHCVSLDCDLSKGHFDVTEEIWSYVTMNAMGL